MKISNAKIFKDGKFVNGSIEFDEKILSINADKAESSGNKAECCSQVANGGSACCGGDECYVIPGLIDVHTHGAMNEDASDGKIEGLEKMSRYYAAGGVTSWCPTTMTLKEPELTAAMHAIRDFERPEDGAKVAGINLEGPFLCLKKCGAQNPDNLHAPDSEMFKRLNDASGGIVRLVSIAPEEPGAMDFIREVSKTCSVSVGHTTADYDTAMAAYEAGATHATHLFNAMPPLAHREPGVIAAAMDSGANVELITDGMHIHPAVVRLVHKLFGDKFVMISDSLRCAGMPDGDYELGGLPITLCGGVARLSGSDTLAGSAVHLMDGLRRTVSFGIPLEDAVYAATEAPAKAIGLEGKIGRLATGLPADIVVLDKDLKLKNVYINGKQVV